MDIEMAILAIVVMDPGIIVTLSAQPVSTLMTIKLSLIHDVRQGYDTVCPKLN